MHMQIGMGGGQRSAHSSSTSHLKRVAARWTNMVCVCVFKWVASELVEEVTSSPW